MKKKISAKILVLAGILFAAGIASVLLGFLFIHSMNKKSQKISNECMEAVTLMADTSTSIEKEGHTFKYWSEEPNGKE